MLAPTHPLFSAPAPYRRAPATPPTFDPAHARRSAPAAVPPSLAPALRSAVHLAPRLREALAVACDERRGIRTVEKLAAAAGCDRRTLWAHWNHALNGRGERLRLEDFLHWLLLLRAVDRKRPALAWAQVAKELGVHPHTLGRLARHLTGCTLREVAAQGHGALLRRFEAEVATPLLSGGDAAGW